MSALQGYTSLNFLLRILQLVKRPVMLCLWVCAQWERVLEGSTFQSLEEELAKEACHEKMGNLWGQIICRKDDRLYGMFGWSFSAYTSGIHTCP